MKLIGNNTTQFVLGAALGLMGHRDKAAPPPSHLSAWLEEVKLPEMLTQPVGSTKTK